MTVMRVMRIAVVGSPTAHHRIAVAPLARGLGLEDRGFTTFVASPTRAGEGRSLSAEAYPWRGFARALRWGMPR